MKKRVWIMNHYAGAMFFDQGGRHYNFAKYLKMNGYEPVVFCCNTMHGKQDVYFPEDVDHVWKEHYETNTQVPYIFIKSRTYIGNGKQRILNMIEFYRNVQKAAKEYVMNNNKPDIIYASSVHPFTLVAGIKLARYFKIPCICEVRDLWPESLVIELPWLKENSLLAKALYKGERWIYKSADRLIFTMEGGYDYITNKKWNGVIPSEKVFHINNGVDLQKYEDNKREYVFEDSDLDNEDIFKVVYTGSIRKANGVEQLVDLASLLKQKDIDNIKILIFGDGEESEKLISESEKLKLDNIVFKGSVEKKYIPSVLSRSNLNLLNYAKSTIKVFEYGSSQNKLFEYLASGVPILSNIHINYSVLEKYDCGIELSEPTSNNYLDSIIRLYSNKERYKEMSMNCKKAAEQYDFKTMTMSLIEIIEQA